MGCLEGIQTSEKLLNEMKEICTNACVKGNGEVGKSFRIYRGVRQGCIMSL